MTRPENVGELRRQVTDARRELDQALAAIPLAQWEDARLEGGWSVKQSLAHVTYWESRVLWRAGLGELEAPPELPEDMDGMNAAVKQWSAELPLSEVRQRAASTHARLLAWLCSLTDAQMDECPEFAQGRPWWEIIADNSAGHYQEHIGQFREVSAPAQ